MTCSRNDVVLLPIPFTDLTSRKVRPAVVVGQNGMDLFLVPIFFCPLEYGYPTCGMVRRRPERPFGIKAQLATIEEKLLIADLTATLRPETERLSQVPGESF